MEMELLSKLDKKVTWIKNPYPRCLKYVGCAGWIDKTRRMYVYSFNGKLIFVKERHRNYSCFEEQNSIALFTECNKNKEIFLIEDEDSNERQISEKFEDVCNYWEEEQDSCIRIVKRENKYYRYEDLELKEEVRLFDVIEKYFKELLDYYCTKEFKIYKKRKELFFKSVDEDEELFKSVLIWFKNEIKEHLKGNDKVVIDIFDDIQYGRTVEISVNNKYCIVYKDEYEILDVFGNCTIYFDNNHIYINSQFIGEHRFNI